MLNDHIVNLCIYSAVSTDGVQICCNKISGWDKLLKCCTVKNGCWLLLTYVSLPASAPSFTKLLLTYLQVLHYNFLNVTNAFHMFLMWQCNPHLSVYCWQCNPHLSVYCCLLCSCMATDCVLFNHRLVVVVKYESL